MASRYDTAGNNDFWTQTSSTTGPSTTQTDSTTNSTGTQTQSGSTNYSKEGQTTTQNMDPASMAALQLLISQLLGGGTQGMAEDKARRLQEIQAEQSMRGQYSKEAAFADAQGAMAQYLRQAMEQSMPTLVRAAEGSGTSQNSMRALLTQDALTRAAQGASALGLQAAANYGTIGSNLSSILERLTQPDNTVTQALLNALNIAKGATQTTQSSESGSTDSSSTANTSGSSTQSGTTANSGSTNTQTSQRGTGAQQFAVPTAGGSLSSFSNSSDPSQLSTTAWNMLAQMAGGSPDWFNNNAWDNYTF